LFNIVGTNELHHCPEIIRDEIVAKHRNDLIKYDLIIIVRIYSKEFYTEYVAEINALADTFPARSSMYLTDGYSYMFVECPKYREVIKNR
jgi:hypothetical protein